MSSSIFWSRNVDRTKPWCVYFITNSVEGLPPFYVGKTRVATMESGGYFGSLKSKKWAEKWHAAAGATPEKFRKRILATFYTENEALAHENMLLRHFRAHMSDLFANMAINCNEFGGCWRGQKRGPHSEEHRAKISESGKGRKISEETRARMSEAQRYKNFSEETRKRMSEAARGRRLSEETRAKISVAQRGKGKSEEHRRKILESRKGR